MNKYYISFANDDGFLGACIVEATQIEMALIVAIMHGCNPGGEALIHYLSDDIYAEEPYPLYTLLQKSDMRDPVRWTMD